MALQQLNLHLQPLCSACKTKIVNDKIKCLSDYCNAFGCAKVFKDKPDCRACRKITPTTTPVTTPFTADDIKFNFDINKYQIKFGLKIKEFSTNIDTKFINFKSKILALRKDSTMLWNPSNKLVLK